MEILKCEGVEKTYGSGGNQAVALAGIDLTVEKPGGVLLHRGYLRFRKVHAAAHSGQCG